MWIIKPSRIREFARRYPQAAPALERWLKLAEDGRWASLVDLRRVFRNADEVRVASGRVAVVFNIKGNDFRLITAIHYNRGKVFVMMFLTHAEYTKDSWKENL
jgi:mRNA interferase HigB